MRTDAVTPSRSVVRRIVRCFSLSKPIRAAALWPQIRGVALSDSSPYASATIAQSASR